MDRKVDIITIPWGINKEVVAISTALAKAGKAGIISLGAGANTDTGRLDPFPAYSSEVIGIGSSNAFGNPSQLSSWFMPLGFCAFGEAVLGAGRPPPDTGKGKQPMRYVVRKSGASIATCVATGLAAMVMDYVRCFLDEKIIKWDTPRMVEFFSKMSESTVCRFYHYVSPWCFFGPNQETEEIAKELMARKLPLASKPSI